MKRKTILLLWLLAMILVPRWGFAQDLTKFSGRTCTNGGDLSTTTTSWQTVSGSIASNGFTRHDVYLTSGRQYIFSLCSDDGGAASIDTYMGLFNGWGCDKYTSENLLAYNDDGCGTASKITYTATSTAWATLYITAYYANTSGTYTLKYKYEDVITAPTVTTNSTATSTTSSSITCGGNLTSTGGASTTRGICYIQGTSGTPTISNTCVSAGSTTSTGTFSVTLSGLSSGTSYRCRAYATNSAGTSYGETYTFTTTSGPSNSTCGNATTLSCGSTLEGTTVGTPGTAHGTGASVSNYGVWYTFTGNGTETTITVNPNSYDIMLVICSGSCNNLSLLHSIDNAVGQESKTFTTENATTYYVYIAHYSSSSTATGTFTISRTCPSTVTLTQWPTSPSATLTGGGSFAPGSHTINATAPEGYQFVNWTDSGGNVVSHNASYTFTLSSDVTYQANFTKTTATSLSWSEGFESGYTHGMLLKGEWATPLRFGELPRVVTYNPTSGSYSLEVRESNSNYCMVVLPQFDQPLNTLVLSFNYKHGDHSSGYNVQLVAITDLNNPTSSSSYTVIKEICTSSQTISNYTSTSNPYTIRLYECPNAPSSSTPRLAIRYSETSSGGDSWYMDNFSVKAVTPATITSVDPSCTSATVAWTGNSTSYTVEYKTSAASSWTTASSSATSPYTINSLNPGTAYQVRVYGDNNSYSAAYNFTTLTQYTVSVSANNGSVGTVSGGGSYCVGSSCTVTATPNACYEFLNWTENDVEVSTSDTYTFTVTGDRDFVANFEDAWTVNPNSGNVNTECITSGTQITLTATSELATLDNYTFTTGTGGSIYSPSWTEMIASGNDDAASSLFDIGFPFVYDGVTYEKFSANSNGNLRLGSEVISKSYYSTPFGSSNYSYNEPKIIGIGRDMSTGSAGYVKTGLYGSTAGSRIRVIEFMLNTGYSTTGTTYVKYQIQLFEATGEVRIVYSGDYSNNPSDYQIGIGNASHNRFWYVNPSDHTATYSTTYTSTTYSVFPGGTRYYSFKPAITFAWSCTSGTSGTASGTNYIVSPTAPTNTYTVTATASGCTKTASVTVTVQQVTPTNVIVSNVTANTATVSWTSSASSWEYSIDGGDTWVAAPSNPMTITGLSPNTSYTVQVRAASAACPSDPATSSSFTTCGEVVVGDHSGTNTDDNLPSRSYFKYSMSEQIYTPCEIGVTGNLNGIAFYNSGSEKTRTYDIYLVTTTKDVFSGTSDWITVSASDKVFSGSVTMTSGAWTWIAFNTAFNYNGASNLAVIVDDNTGSDSNGMTCRVYNASGYQAMYHKNDSNNNNPTSPSYSGTRLTVKNQVKFSSCDMVTPTQVHVTVSANDDAYGTVSGGGCFLQGAGSTTTVTATPNACYEFVNWTVDGVEVSTSDTYTFTVTGDCDLVANFQDTWTVNPNSGNVNTECITSGTQVVLTASTDLPIEYNFTVASGTYSDISGSSSISGDDYASSVISLGDNFYFNYWGKNYNTVVISTNGYLAMGSGSDTRFNDLASSSYYNFLAAFWEDLVASSTKYTTTGTAPNRVFIMQFNGYRYSDSSNPFTYQIKLYETTNVIEFWYGSGFPNVSNSSTTASIGINTQVNGTTSFISVTPTGSGTATISTTEANNSIGTTQCDYLTSGTIYRFTPTQITYAWSCTSGTSGTASTNTYTVTPTASTNTYAVTATSSGCSKTSTVTVTVKDATPTDVTINNITSTTATASWTSSASSSWEYRLNGGSWVTTSSNPVNLTGLTPGTNYTFEVRTAGTTCPSDPGTGTFTTLSLYTLTVSTNPSGSGFTATGGGTYEAGTSHTVNTSTTNSNYVFAFWWNEGTSTVASTNASFSYGPLNGNTTLVAYYAPLSIANATQWAEFSTVINRGFSYSGRTVPLTADINLSGYTGGPAGTGTNPFQGSFDGNGHCITNYSSSNVTHNGLFGYVRGSGNISNVIVKATLDGTSDAAGAIVGTFASSGTISNVEGAGSVSSSSANANIGGLVGNMSNGTLHSSFAVNSLSATQSSAKVGGLVGTNSGNLYNSYSNVTINATPTTKGGLVGIHGSGKFVANCYAALGSQSFPAFAYTNNGTIEFCYADVANGYVNSGNAPSSHGTFSAVQSSTKHLDYMYRDNLITLASGTSTTYVPESGTFTYVDNHIPVWNGLVSALNQWVRGNPRNINGLAPWFRPLTTNINGDLPVLGFGGETTLGTADGSPKTLKYGTMDDLLTIYSGSTASIFHYGKATGVTHVPTANVNVYIDEDAVLLQATNPNPGSFINTTVGVTFDNSDHGTHAYDYWGNKLNYDWHLLSTPLSDLKTGAVHSNYTEGTLPNSQVDITNIGGYFPDGLITSGNPAVGGTIKWDFYTYYEPEYHWINLKRNKNNHIHQDGGAPIHYNQNDQDTDGSSAYYIPGKGYEMAINQVTYMNATGTLNRGNVPITLTNSEPDDINYAKGWNLVGNPYQAYLNIEEVNMDPIYTYDADQGTFVPYTTSASENPEIVSQYIHPHQAFFVHASSNNEELLFTQTMATTDSEPGSYFRDDKVNYPLVNLFAEDGAGHCDLTVIEFHRPELGGAPKLDYMRTSPFSLAAHHAGKSYGILFVTDDIERVPVKFKPSDDGLITLTWITHNGEFSKLLLIDNKLGVEHNMLADNSYTFEASPDDYSSRFYIVYDCSGMGVEENDESGASTGSATAATFAYINNGNIVIDIGSDHGASIQVIDVLGRVLYSKTIAGTNGTCTVSTKGLAKGVYLVRLADGHNVKTQKLVVQ